MSKAAQGGKAKKKTCFVIAPIGDEGGDIRKNSDTVLEYLIRRPLASFNYEIKRADEINQSGIITVQLIDSIIKADLVIADLSGGNPNVFYELAICDSYRKPAVLLYDKKSKDKIPFDVSHRRIVFYSSSNQGLFENAKDEIVAHVRAIGEGKPTYSMLQQVEMIQQIEGGAGVPKILGEILRILSVIQADASTAATYANQQQTINPFWSMSPSAMAFGGHGKTISLSDLMRPSSTGPQGVTTIVDPIAPESFEDNDPNTIPPKVKPPP